MTFSRWRLPLASLLALLLGGCLQVEVTIQMHDDGSAIVTERVRFSQALMELDRTAPADQQVRRLLERPAIEARMKEMGKGIALQSHAVTSQPDGGRESIAVYKIPDVEDLRLVNPFLAGSDPNRLMKLQFSPIYKVVHSFHALGELMLAVVPAETPKRETPASQPATPAPVDLQIVRHLAPMFGDMMRGFQVRLRLIATKPITWGYVRDRGSATKIIDLLLFTDQDLDAYGVRFLENEELMLNLMRLQFDAELIADQVQGFAGNATLPVFRCRKPYGSGTFRLPPNPHQFQKYFHGRPKSEGGDQ
jgi:hypothetical protein